MKRLWLTSAILVLLLLTGVGTWVWFGLPRSADAPNEDQAGKLTSLKNELTRGYHTAALFKQFRDDKPESILLVVQNDWELRATGGFITAFGEGQIINGQLHNFRIVPSEYFDPEIQIAAPMPEGLAYRISTPTLAMRDANWDVDFSTTAATVSRYYADATGTTPDVVVAITTKAAERILAHTGSLDFTVNGHTLTVTSETVTEVLERYTDQEFRDLGLEWETRKQILSAFGDALLPKVHE